MNLFPRKSLIVNFIFLLIFTSTLTTISVNATSTTDNSSTAPTTKTSTETSQSLVDFPSGPNVVAESAIVMEVNSGLILYQKNISEKMYPASITKILTTLLAVENSSLSEEITFSENAVNSIEPGSTHVGIAPGEKLTMEQALHAVMLESANEVSNGVAEHVGGTIENFVSMMNQRAKEIGCTNTHFENANGLHNDNHYVTAYDMGLIASEAYKNPTFRTIAGTTKYVIPATNLQNESRYFSNHHVMFNPSKYPSYDYEYCTGGKTGYTMAAGNTLVSYAEKDGMELVCVVLKSKSTNYPENEYTDTISLFNFVFDNFSVHQLESPTDNTLLSDTQLFTKFSSVFTTDTSPIKLNDTNYVVLPNGANINDIKSNIIYYSNDQKSNDSIIGEINYSYGDTIVGKADIVYDSTVQNNSFLNNKIINENLSSTSLLGTLNQKYKNLLKSKTISILTVVLVIIVILEVLYLFLLRKKKHERNYYRRKRRY